MARKRKAVGGARFGYGEAHGRLQPILYVAEHCDGALAGTHCVAACADVVGIAAVAHQSAHGRHGVSRSHRLKLGKHGVLRVVVVYVDIFDSVFLREPGEEIIVGKPDNDNYGRNGGVKIAF